MSTQGMWPPAQPTAPPQPGQSGWWARRSKKAKTLIAAGGTVVALAIIGSFVDSNSTSSTATAAGADAPAEPGDQVAGVVSGDFHRDCLLCDTRLASYVQTSNVWCGWEDGSVVVHVTMRNDSVEHLTVDWHPSYVIAGGGEHGAGLTAVQSHGFDSGEKRELSAEQDPEGVPEGSPIEECKPSFSTIESG